MEGVEDQQGALQTPGRHGADGRVGQQVNQRLDVVTAEHGAEQFGSYLPGDPGAGFFILGNLGQELGLDLGGVIDTGWNAKAEQLDQGRFLACRRVLQQGDQFDGLLFGEGQRGDTKGCTFGDVGAIGFKHGDFLS